ncbi:MAG6450 family protein [Mycoplasmopsis bovis]
MNKKLTSELNLNKKTNLFHTNKEIVFKFAIVNKLGNGYDFKSLDLDGLKKFNNFVNDILEKKMTISQVEKTYMRKRFKPLVKRHIEEQDMDVREIHLGKDQQKFRLFGYFNENNYFVLTKIDSKHSSNE